MPQYVLKVLVELDARDDIEARKNAAALTQTPLAQLPGVRDIVLHAKGDNKSIRMNADGTFPGQWNKGGAAASKQS
jgi:hypothetical protein